MMILCAWGSPRRNVATSRSCAIVPRLVESPAWINTSPAGTAMRAWVLCVSESNTSRIAPALRNDSTPPRIGDASGDTFGVMVAGETERATDSVADSFLRAVAAAPEIPIGAIAPGTIVQGRFRTEQPLGRGGMGVVWRALDLQLGRSIA